MKKATFGAGCFWGVEKIVRAQFPDVNTRVGYTGGTHNSPSYKEVCKGTTGHAEVIEISYNPEKVEYRALVNLFFRLHDPTQLNRQGNDIGTQYRSAIFYHDDDQLRIAKQEKQSFDDKNIFNKKSTTEITPATEFYVAEDYHQDYLEKNPSGYMCHILRPEY